MKNLTLSILEFCAETGRDRAAVTKGLKAQGVTIENRAEYRVGVLVRACLNDGKEARARLTTAQAEREEIEVAKLRKLLVEVPAVSRILLATLGILRDKLVNFGETLAPQVNAADPVMAVGALNRWRDGFLASTRDDVVMQIFDRIISEECGSETNEHKDRTQEGGEGSKAVVPEKPSRKARRGHVRPKPSAGA